jgi:hypothetical protein
MFQRNLLLPFLGWKRFNRKFDYHLPNYNGTTPWTLVSFLWNRCNKTEIPWVQNTYFKVYFENIHHHRHWHNSPIGAQAFFRNFRQPSLFLAALFRRILDSPAIASSDFLTMLFSGAGCQPCVQPPAILEGRMDCFLVWVFITAKTYNVCKFVVVWYIWKAFIYHKHLKH